MGKHDSANTHGTAEATADAAGRAAGGGRPASARPDAGGISGDVAPGSARATARQWLDGWIARDWQAVERATTLTWRADHHEGAVALVLPPWEITDAELAAEIAISPVVTDLDVRLAVAGRPTLLVTLRLVRESGPYRPDPAGTWGVNPVSAALRMGEI